MQKKSSGKTSIFKTLGPGFLLAGAAIGVSHLVQATRAGADYGFLLIWVLIIACITKYPFLEFGPRYAAGTGNHLITGYKKLGKLPYWTFIIITIGGMFIVEAAVTIVTAGLAERLFGMGWSTFTWSFVIIGFCIALLLIGKYPALDKTMKAIVSLLGLATLTAVILAFGEGRLETAMAVETPDVWNKVGIAFIISFMGWMPIPLDASVWHSIWTKEKALSNKRSTSLKEAFFDFNIGYLAAAVIGLLFFLMGALIMFGSGIGFSGNGVEFSGQLVDLYGKTLGDWSKPIVAVAALIAMLSTTLAVTDAIPRVISEIFAEEKPQWIKEQKWKNYRLNVFIIPILSLLILYFFTASFTVLIDFATALSFLSAPVLAWFNYKLVTSDQMKIEDRPDKKYRIFSIICLGVLILFNLAYITTWFI
ncbi:NRAMP family divalent metal transporter [Christiangramia echinicola]|uniref:Mn2+ and Fe2+ transporters of the NRAMP family n=1 Tax=Christiangramia echinicola TaxID=279359 RepID=A0A1H1QIN7_9FLAO|nr:divalent metal cation transporter [Christiangramia echinicola]SDS23236.1 Mn2+ and Fe2+ transporters of the NRAMP family [Christiangramia echinicola]